jgi:DNA-binding NtrC family response regulator
VSARDKTQTAVHAPLSPAELADIAILSMQGSAHAPGQTPARRLVLVRDGLDIGRAPSPEPSGAEDAARDTLALPDPLVSSSHARLARTAGGTYQLADLGSKNGTFVDGRRVERPVVLRSGAIVFLGNHVAVFRMVSALALEAIRADLASPLGPVATTSPALALACDRMRRLAAADGEMLLLGETGVGKEVYARAVHQRSGRRGRFVAINCGAIPRDLVESELFGYRQGAHSTAHAAKPGLIEEAEGGTLFLDEIGEMTHEAQIKLLRFLQDRELTPLGSTRPRKLDVRIIAATNRAMRAAGAAGGADAAAIDGPGDAAPARAAAPASASAPAGLRDDVVGRLGVSPICLPPLRDRIDDLGALTAHFLRGAATRSFDQVAFRALALHPWPLNVRELEKSVATAAVLTGGERPISLRDLPAALAEPRPPAAAGVAPSLPAPPGPSALGPAPAPASPPTPTPTVAQLEELLGRHHGNVAEVARALGKQRAAVWRWMKKWGIGVERFRRPD